MRPAVLSAALLLCGPLSAAAVTRTWDGGGGTALFSTAGNWNPDGAPATSYRLERSVNLTQWTAVQTVAAAPVSGALSFSTTADTSVKREFYRIVLP
jgi:hypothetical protein